MRDTLFETDSKVVIYTDGGARGNPGPAAIGVTLLGHEYGERIGIATNNVAEYKALIFGMKKAKQLLGKAKAKKAEVEIRMDSELVVKQMQHIYKIEEAELQKLFVEAWNLILDFGSVGFVHVPRAKNAKADALVNKALDAS